MPADWFQPVDRVDPPDLWPEVAQRVADDTDLILDADPGDRRPLVRQPRTWIATAAVIALVAGGIALTRSGGDGDRVLTDTTSTAVSEPRPETVFIDGACPFTVELGPNVPDDLAPGRHDLEPEIGILTGPIPPTFAHGASTDLLVEIAVGSTLATSAEPGGLRALREGDRGSVEVFGRRTDEGSTACGQVMVAVRMPMRAVDLDAVDSREGIPMDPYQQRAEPVIEAVLAAVRNEGSSPSTSGPGTDSIPANALDPDFGMYRQVEIGPEDATGPAPDGNRIVLDVTGNKACAGLIDESGRGDTTSCTTPPDETRSPGVGISEYDGPPPFTLLLGERPPGTVHTYAVRPDGTRTQERVVVSPDGRWYVTVHPDTSDDIAGNLGNQWPIVHTDADGRELTFG